MQFELICKIECSLDFAFTICIKDHRHFGFENWKKRIKRSVLSRPANTPRRTFVHLLSLTITLCVKQHLPHRREYTHERPGIGPATKRCEPNMHRHWGKDKHILRPGA